MNRIKTFDATGIAPNGKLYAGDLNLLQDAAAGLSDFTQTIQASVLEIGDSSLGISKYGSGQLAISAAARFSGILTMLAGFVPASYTTTQRDALTTPAAGTVILNTTTGFLEWNAGTSGTPSWQVLGATGKTGTGGTQVYSVSPALTGTPTAPTPAGGDSSTKIATTAFVAGSLGGVDLSGYAPLASPALTGNPTAPTQTGTDNSTKIATTAFVLGQLYAKLAGPTFTGTVTIPTPTVGDNTTKAASTAFVQTALYTILTLLNVQSANYTLALTDNLTLVEMDVASANNLTVPNNSSVAFPAGTTISVVQKGAGQTTVVAGSGVTVRAYNSNMKLAGQYAMATLIKRATNEWYLAGNLVP